MYNVVKTWAIGDAWPITDANTYIRDNMASIRRYQTSGQQFIDSGTVTASSLGAVGTNHTGMLSSVPDEDFQMIVMCFIEAAPATAASVNIGLQDSFGNYIGYITPSGNFGLSGSYGVSIAYAGGRGYTSGQSPGVSLVAYVPSGSVNLYWSMIVMFRPLI